MPAVLSRMLPLLYGSCHQRRHRPDPPRTHRRPCPQLPAHWPATRTPARNRPQNQTPRTLMRGHSDVLRHRTHGPYGAYSNRRDLAESLVSAVRQLRQAEGSWPNAMASARESSVKRMIRKYGVSKESGGLSPTRLSSAAEDREHGEHRPPMPRVARARPRRAVEHRAPAAATRASESFGDCPEAAGNILVV